MEPVAIWIPLVVGSTAVTATIIIHAVSVAATVRFVRHQRRVGHVGTGFWTDVTIVAVATSFMLAAHVLEIGMWAALFMGCGEFSESATAFYHSGVNYTTLGYGDLVMSWSWRFLGPLEAANGMLLFGVSTAVIIAVVQRLVEARFPDLRA